MNQDNKIAVAYIRVSTAEQREEGISLETQEEACVEKIAKDGFRLLKVIADGGKSASSLKRDGIQEVIELIKDRSINAVYAVASDRLARQVTDHIYLRELAKTNGVELRYVYQQSPHDSAIGKMADTVLASFNQLYRDNISDKVKQAIHPKASAGYYPSLGPIGYKNVTNTDPKALRIARRIIVPDPERASLITEAFSLYATGSYNVYDLSDILYEKGLRALRCSKLTAGRLCMVLRNRIYLGEIHWGEIHEEKGKHEPLTDRHTFQRVQDILRTHNKHACRRRKYSWLLNGFVWCYKHGKRYTAEWHLDKNTSIAYYHCSNRHGCGKYIEISKLEDQVAKKFQDLEFNPLFIEALFEKVKAIFYQRRQQHEGKRQGLINQRTAFEGRLKVAEDRLLDGTLANDDFKRVQSEHKDEINDIDDRIQRLDKDREMKVNITEEILSFAKNIFTTYSRATNPLKRHYLSFFWERFEVENGVIITSVPSLFFRELLSLQQIYQKKKNHQNTGDFSHYTSGIIPLLGRE